MKYTLILTAVVCSAIFSSCMNARIKEHDDWKQYFDKYGVEGCFEYYDNNKETAHFYNKERAALQLTPASTFKIFNSLVALETHTALDEQMVIKWDSTVRENPLWNRDLTMKEAFKVSAVPYYQELARRIGAKEMQWYLDTAKYGNMNLNGAIDQFWLNDTLKISADEQVGLMKRLYFGELPGFSERSQRIVRGMMLQKETENYKLYYKTGWGKSKGKDILWIVGFLEQINELKNVETDKIDRIPHPYFFALNFTAGTEPKDWQAIRLQLLEDLLTANRLNK